MKKIARTGTVTWTIPCSLPFA